MQICLIISGFHSTDVDLELYKKWKLFTVRFFARIYHLFLFGLEFEIRFDKCETKTVPKSIKSINLSVKHELQ